MKARCKILYTGNSFFEQLKFINLEPSHVFIISLLVSSLKNVTWKIGLITPLGFPLAAIRMTSHFLHSCKKKENKTKENILIHLLIVYTQQLEILVLALFIVGDCIGN